MPEEINNNNEEATRPIPITEEDIRDFMVDLEADYDRPSTSSAERRVTRNFSYTLPDYMGTPQREFSRNIQKENDVKVEDVTDPKTKVNLYEGGKALYGDCVYAKAIGYFKKDDPRIVKDYTLFGTYLVLDIDLIRKFYGSIYGVCDDIDAKGNLVVSGYTMTGQYNSLVYIIQEGIDFTLARYYLVTNKLCTNPLFRYAYKEDLSTGSFFHKSQILAAATKKLPGTLYRKCKRRNTFAGFVKNKPNTYIKMLGKKYTFGYEIETSSGLLPARLDETIFFDAVHDGSLRDANGNVTGGEYVTDVLYGDLGLQQLKMLCTELTKRCYINKLCGNHIHLGGVTFNKENIVLMYYLYQKLEPAIFNMLPASRRQNAYCRPLPSMSLDLNLIKANYDYGIEKYYSDIIRLLASGNQISSSVNKKKDHPKGFKCGYDHSTARYCWVNFIPAVFNTRKSEVYTIEFRPHSATTSYYKCKQWLLICIALVDIIENHKAVIYNNPDITLADIITLVYPNNHAELNNYIAKRVDKFSVNNKEDQEALDHLENEFDEDKSIKNL